MMLKNIKLSKSLFAYIPQTKDLWVLRSVL